MSVARITEISSSSEKSFEDAVAQGIARATETIRNVRSAWIKEQEVQVREGKVSEYKVIMLNRIAWPFFRSGRGIVRALSF